LDFDKLTTEDYIKDKVLNINIPVENEKDIIKTFLFTEGNFIKLILISLRLRSKIPVIFSW